MKKCKVPMLLVLLMLLSILAATAFADSVVKGSEIQEAKSISINTPASKLTYKIGEELDVTGLTIKAILADDSEQIVDVDQSMITGFSSAAVNNALELTISCGGQTTSYSVKVEDAVKSIAVAKGSYKTDYKLGEELDVTGLSIEVTMLSGDKSGIPVTASMVTGFNSKSVTAQLPLTISYQGAETKLNVSVSDAVASIAVVKAPNKVAYKLREQLDLTGLKVQATMLSGGKEEVEVSTLTASGFDSSKEAEKQTITLTDPEGKKATFDVKIINAVESIAVNSTGHKTQYKIKDALDVTGLTIRVVMQDGTDGTVQVNSKMVTGFDNRFATTKQTLTITYQDVTTTYAISISDAVESIAVNSTKHKTDYKLKDELSVADLSIEVTMLSGATSTVSVTTAMISGFSTKTESSKLPVTITYEGKTTTYYISVSNAVESITVNSTKHKTDYKVKDKLDVTDLTIEVLMLNTSKSTIPVTADMISGFQNTTPAEKETLIITYQGATTTLDIVMANDIESIAIKTPADKLDYRVKDELDVTGLTIEPIMLDGTRGDAVPVTADMISGFSNKAAHEEQVLTITYLEKYTAAYTISIVNAPTSIKVNSTAHKTVYKTGEVLDVTGLTIEATMLDDTKNTVPVTSRMVTGFDSEVSTPEQTLTITYEDVTTTFTIKVEPIVKFSGTCGSGMSWTLDNEGLMIVSGSGAMKDYYEQGLAPWYAQRASIKTVRINDGVTGIGAYAFYNCSALKKLTIPDSVKSIGMDAFSGCSTLTEIAIPEQVSSIGHDAFTGTPWITAQGDFVVVNGLLLKYQGTTAGPVIPEGVTTIVDRAFYECTTLKSVAIPEGVTAIGDSAFYGCSALGSVTIPSTVNSIEDFAFYNCTALIAIHFNPVALTHFGNGVFEQAGAQIGNLTVTIGDGVKKIPAAMFDENTALSDLRIGESVTEIGSYAFRNCKNLSELQYNATALTGLGSDVFAYIGVSAGKLKIEVGDSAESIPDRLFYHTNALSTLTLGQKLTSIGAEAFFDCDNLSTVEIPNNVKTIGKAAFSSCTNLKNLTLGNGLVTIGSNAFYECTALSSVVIPNSTVAVGENAFWKCTALESASIGSSVETVGSSAFWGCTALKRLTIGKSVATIGTRAFYGATALTEINYNAKAVTSLGTSIWDNAGTAGSGITVHFGASVKKLPASLFEAGNTAVPKIEKLIFEGNAPTIGTNAFVRLTAMTYYPYGDTSWTASVRKNYGGTLTWVPSSVAEVVSAQCTCDKLTYIIGDKLDTDSMRMTITRADGCVENYDYATGLLELSDYDMNKTGAQTITVKCKGSEAQVQIYVCAVERKTMAKADYPESHHNYGNNISETYNYQVPNALSMSVTFSKNTEVEAGNCDSIYVNGKQYTGKELAGKTLDIDGDKLTIRLVSDGSETYYGFAIEKIEANVVVLPEVSAIQINSTAHKTVYRVGNSLDVSGLTVLVTRANGTQETIAVKASMVTGFDSSAMTAKQLLTITYGGKTTTYSIRIDSAIVKGDLDNNSEINQADAAYLLNYTLNPERYTVNQSVDFDGDGFVTDADAIYLMNHVTKPDSYPLY